MNPFPVFPLFSRTGRFANPLAGKLGRGHKPGPGVLQDQAPAMESSDRAHEIEPEAIAGGIAT
jgi:hypothetical protein